MNKLELNINGEIGYNVLANNIEKQLNEFKGNEIVVNINSMGGSVFDGFAIYNAIKNHPAQIKTARVSSSCMSVATIIMLACDVIQAEFASVIMIHRPSCFAFVGGDKDQIRKDSNAVAQMLEQIEQIAIPLYETRLNKTSEEVFEMLDKETSLSALSAFNLGLVDEVLNPPKATMLLNSIKMLFGGDKFKEQILKEAQMLELSQTKKQEPKGYNMKHKTVADLISALLAFAEKLTDEQKAELIEITEAIEIKEAKEEEPEPKPEPKEEDPKAQAKELAEMKASLAEMKASLNAKDEMFGKMFAQMGKPKKEEPQLKGFEKTKSDYTKIYLSKGEK